MYRMFKKFPLYPVCLALASGFFSCQESGKVKNNLPHVGFLDFVKDETLEKAKRGFFDALDEKGLSEKSGTLHVTYLNAQGDIPVLGQSCDLLISKKVDVIAANTTLSTITAVQRTQTIPVCMMVAPRPDLAKLTDESGNPPSNLFGAFETLDYIDTSVAIIQLLKPDAKIIGTVYNQSEPQSRDAFNRLQVQCNKLNLQLISLPVNHTGESQLVVQTLLSKNPDVFFALPDNVIFASFETIIQACDEARVPVFTSEAGLVARGAVASFGADFYQWGFQAGLQTAEFLSGKPLSELKPEIVKVRKRLLNEQAAKEFGIAPQPGFELINNP